MLTKKNAYEIFRLLRLFLEFRVHLPLLKLCLADLCESSECVFNPPICLQKVILLRFNHHIVLSDIDCFLKLKMYYSLQYSNWISNHNIYIEQF